MKKVFAIVLAIAMMFAFAACGEKDGGEGGGEGGGSNGNYKAAIDLFLSVKYENAADKIEQLMPETFWKFYEEQTQMPRTTFIDETKYVIGQTQIEISDQFGDDYKLTPTMTEAVKVSADNLKTIAAAFELQKGIKAANIKEAYELNVTIIFNNQYEWEDFDVGVIKIDNTWYCAEWAIYEGGAAVNFLLEEIPFAG